MKIEDVVINNWQAPGEGWWSGVEARPTEPLIDATIKLTLSWNEYRALLDRDERMETPTAALSNEEQAR